MDRGTSAQCWASATPFAIWPTVMPRQPKPLPTWEIYIARAKGNR